jgi:hypothetical protein
VLVEVLVEGVTHDVELTILSVESSVRIVLGEVLTVGDGELLNVSFSNMRDLSLGRVLSSLNIESSRMPFSLKCKISIFSKAEISFKV